VGGGLFEIPRELSKKRRRLALSHMDEGRQWCTNSGNARRHVGTPWLPQSLKRRESLPHTRPNPCGGSYQAARPWWYSTTWPHIVVLQANSVTREKLGLASWHGLTRTYLKVQGLPKIVKHAQGFSAPYLNRLMEKYTKPEDLFFFCSSISDQFFLKTLDKLTWSLLLHCRTFRASNRELLHICEPKHIYLTIKR